MWKRLQQFADLRRLPDVELFGRKIRTVTLVALVAALTVMWVYNEHVLGPSVRRVRLLRKRLAAREVQLEGLRAKLPQLDEQERVVAEEQARAARLTARLRRLEIGSPRMGQMSELVKDLSALGRDHGVDFISIQPGTVRKEQFYERYPVHMEMIGEYDALVRYIDALESVTQFGSVVSAEIQLSAESDLPQAAVTYKILFGSTAGDVPGPSRVLVEGEGARDPFQSEQRPQRPEQVLTGYKVHGLLHDGGTPTAILNEQIVHVGETIDGKRVEAIHKDHLVLSEGKRTYHVYLGASN